PTWQVRYDARASSITDAREVPREGVAVAGVLALDRVEGRVVPLLLAGEEPDGNLDRQRRRPALVRRGGDPQRPRRRPRGRARAAVVRRLAGDEEELELAEVWGDRERLHGRGHHAVADASGERSDAECAGGLEDRPPRILRKALPGHRGVDGEV